MPSPMSLGGPAITPKTLTSAGQGGQAAPPYLQTRTPMMPGMPAQPVVTPKPTAPGDSVGGMGKPAMSAPGTSEPSGGAPPQAGGQNLNDVYGFFKSDLENQKNQALASTKADASARGVYYGTPLTGSEADINTQYLRGLGQLQSGMYGNEQQNQLARLGLASSMGWQNSLNAPPMPGQTDFSSLGALFSPQPNANARTGPAITPKGNTVPGQQGTPYGQPGTTSR